MFKNILNSFAKGFIKFLNCFANGYMKFLNWLSKKIAEVIKKIMR